MIQLTGPSLAKALQLTEKPIKRLDKTGAFLAELSPGDNIALYLERGYDAFGSATRVKYIRPSVARPYVQWRECHLNSRASVIRFHGGIGYQGTGVRELSACWA